MQPNTQNTLNLDGTYAHAALTEFSMWSFFFAKPGTHNDLQFQVIAAHELKTLEESCHQPARALYHGDE